MIEFMEYLVSPYETYTTAQIWIEALAAFFGVLSVYFAAKNNILVFPTGIISTGLYVYLLFNWDLWGDMVVNGYYFMMSIYGWIHWSGKDNHDIELPITWMKKSDWVKSLLLFLGSLVFVLGLYYYKPFLESKLDQKILNSLQINWTWVNYVDATTTSIFFVGMWLMAKKKIENWIFWIIGDLAVIPMFLHKGFAITALQYIIFVIPAIMGWIEWKKIIKTQNNNTLLNLKN